ncbi:hypothetical protein BDP55DRAFT_413622 [Colletotrichum godetiae]|uniref:Uncharacterized protein n=1 Tax=Colletotrichum godetiae TaxID=1209918 RepID=A0AAJ0AAH2_9PEZI|nr:uncharacterized protein BDP55DRAFT_413622 [Colletotrichum godetiae]KAK1658012.1 hypothetical protein BDP55DRAFT_413622 [Colletotrichum godetiae]
MARTPSPAKPKALHKDVDVDATHTCPLSLAQFTFDTISESSDVISTILSGRTDSMSPLKRGTELRGDADYPSSRRVISEIAQPIKWIIDLRQLDHESFTPVPFALDSHLSCPSCYNLSNKGL